MKKRTGFILLGLICVGLTGAQGQSAGVRNLGDGGLWLDFRPRPTSIPNTAVSRKFFLESSPDMATWDQVDEIDLTNAYAYQSGLRVPSELTEGEQRFFRFRTDETYHYTSDNAADYLGLEGIFTSALLERFFDKPVDLLTAYPSRSYLNDLPWDVSTAEFWNMFDTDPAVNNEGRDPMEDGWRAVDYRLNVEERAIFDKNGFVVSERLGTYSFGDAFYDLWTDDLPVYISTDALLQAWHYSFQKCLEEVDEIVMAHELGQILSSLRAGLEAQRSLYESGDAYLKQAFEDTDFFLTVAHNLVLDSFKVGFQAPSFADSAAVSDFEQRAERAEGVLSLPVFGGDRIVDFTQFTPRGHYVNSLGLTRYFQSMMWCLRIDFRLTSNENSERAKAIALRQLGAAALLTQLVNATSSNGSWESMENVIAAVGGFADSLMPPQMAELLEAAELKEFGAVATTEIADTLQARLLEGSLGIQNIRSHAIISPLSQQQAVLPRSFTFFSQRFVLDSWAMSKVVFDSIIDDDNGIPELSDKIQRRIPSGLDVAFSTLANDEILPTIVQRMQDTNGNRWRDGLPYQNNLAATRFVIDNQPPSAWEGNIYHHWLRTLRTLSDLPDSPNLPHAMQTEAWAMKDVTTQLASWTHLRHDTILYAKQSSTALTICLYPDGYVEPRPAFWQSLRTLAAEMQNLIATLPGEGTRTYDRVSIFGSTETFEIKLATWKESLSNVFKNFASTTAQLESLVAKELADEAFTPADLEFIDGMMQGGGAATSGGQRRYDGWYPRMFYKTIYDEVDLGADKFDALVTDVHTDFPDQISGDPGTILHEGVGGVNLLMIAIERENGRKVVYAGPVLSYYEFYEEGSMERRTDQYWQNHLRDSPTAPEPWTEGYLVPSDKSGQFPFQ
ncbi:MAG: hypothetical protein ACI9R3_002896 [Verrucomicrobiales bacterium]|jgi:hypothetical protein